MSSVKAGNKNRAAPIIPRINKNKKVVAESSEEAAQTMMDKIKQGAGDQS